MLSRAAAVGAGTLLLAFLLMTPASVRAASLTFVATADATVSSAQPSKSFGKTTDPSVRLGASTTATFRTYITFQVAGLIGPIGAARLHLYVTDPSPDGGTTTTSTRSIGVPTT